MGKSSMIPTFSIRQFKFGKMLVMSWAVTGVFLWFSVINMLGGEPNPESMTPPIIILPAQLGILFGIVLFPLSVCYILYRGGKAILGLVRTKK